MSDQDSKKGLFSLRKTAAVCTAAVFLFLGGFIFAFCLLDLLCPGIFKVAKGLALIKEESFFYSKGDSENLSTAALRGIAEELNDDYAAYYTEDEYESLNKTESGYSVGIGILIEQTQDSGCLIKEVYSDTAASEAGILAGDKLIFVNDVSAEENEFANIINAFKVNEGEENTLVIERNGLRISFSVIVREYFVPYASFRMLNENTGYIYISAFHGKVADEVNAAVNDMLESGMTRLVLDVRNNPGGMMDDALDIADIFLEEGRVITRIRDADGKEQTYYAKNKGIDLPIVILVNERTASASELLASALRDNVDAAIIGDNTYGKGIVQTYFDLGNSDGVLKITTEAYYTPDGICIQGEGIIPDIEQSLPEEYSDYVVSMIPEDKDTQLMAALELLDMR